MIYNELMILLGCFITAFWYDAKPGSLIRPLGITGGLFIILDTFYKILV